MPPSTFAAQFEQLLTASSWGQRLPILKKLRENKCELPEFVFFYEQHLNQHYRVLLTSDDRQAQDTHVRRLRLHNVKRLLQQRINLNTQLGVESVLG